ncbi:MAG: hypothetical protein LBF24_01915, partial [Puniceicoccales bacterium]|nr:hypothetical protein [Puniceicoccales bacterium]
MVQARYASVVAQTAFQDMGRGGGILEMPAERDVRQGILRRIENPAIVLYLLSTAFIGMLLERPETPGRNDKGITGLRLAKLVKQSPIADECVPNSRLLEEAVETCEKKVLCQAAWLAMALCFSKDFTKNILFMYGADLLDGIEDVDPADVALEDRPFCRARIIHDVMRGGNVENVSKIKLEHLVGMDRAWVSILPDSASSPLPVAKRLVTNEDKSGDRNYMRLLDFCLLRSVSDPSGRIRPQRIWTIARGNRDIFRLMLQIGTEDFRKQCGTILIEKLSQLLRDGKAAQAAELLRNLPPEAFQKWGVGEDPAGAANKEADTALIKFLFENGTAEQLSAINPIWWNRKIISGYDDPATLPRWQSKEVRNLYARIPPATVAGLSSSLPPPAGAPNWSGLYLLFGVLQFGDHLQLGALRREQIDQMLSKNVLAEVFAPRTTPSSILLRIGTEVILGNGSDDGHGDRWKDAVDGKIFPVRFKEIIGNLPTACELVASLSCHIPDDFWQFVTKEQAAGRGGLLSPADVRAQWLSHAYDRNIENWPIYPVGTVNPQQSYEDAYVARNCFLLHAFLDEHWVTDAEQVRRRGGGPLEADALRKKLTVQQKAFLLNWVAKRWRTGKSPCAGMRWRDFGFDSEDVLREILPLLTAEDYAALCRHQASGEEPVLSLDVIKAVTTAAFMAPKFAAHGRFSEADCHAGLTGSQILEIGTGVAVSGNQVADAYGLAAVCNVVGADGAVPGKFSRKDYLTALFHDGAKVTPVLRKLVDHLRTRTNPTMRTAAEEEVRKAVLWKMYLLGGDCSDALTDEECTEVRNGIARHPQSLARSWGVGPTVKDTLGSFTRADFERYHSDGKLNPPFPGAAPLPGVARLEESFRHAILRHVYCNRSRYIGGGVMNLQAFGAERLVEVLNCSKHEGRTVGGVVYPNLFDFGVKSDGAHATANPADMLNLVDREVFNALHSAGKLDASSDLDEEIRMAILTKVIHNPQGYFASGKLDFKIFKVEWFVALLNYLQSAADPNGKKFITVGFPGVTASQLVEKVNADIFDALLEKKFLEPGKTNLVDTVKFTLFERAYFARDVFFGLSPRKMQGIGDFGAERIVALLNFLSVDGGRDLRGGNRAARMAQRILPQVTAEDYKLLCAHRDANGEPKLQADLELALDAAAFFAPALSNKADYTGSVNAPVWHQTLGAERIPLLLNKLFCAVGANTIDAKFALGSVCNAPAAGGRTSPNRADFISGVFGSDDGGFAFDAVLAYSRDHPQGQPGALAPDIYRSFLQKAFFEGDPWRAKMNVEEFAAVFADIDAGTNLTAFGL